MTRLRGERLARQSLNAGTLQDILADLGIEVRFNELVHNVQIFDRDGILCESEQPLDTLIAYICDTFRDSYKFCGKEQVAQSLHLIAVRHPVNPILDKVRNASRELESDNYIREIAGSIMRIPQEDVLSHTLVHKWFLQAMALAQNDSTSPFGGDGMLVLSGAQGIGKSLFCDCAALESQYYRVLTLNPYQDDADILSKASGAFVGEFGELEKSLKPSTIEMFKAFITANKDSYRPKYGRAVNDYVRRTSFIATCNTNAFLFDKTGNRRFWVIPCREQFDINRLARCKTGKDDIFARAYAQAYKELRKNGMQSFRLTDAERQQLEKRNAGYMCVPSIDSILQSLIESGGLPDEFTIEELKQGRSELGAYDNGKIGRALSRFGLSQHIRKTHRSDGRQTTERVYNSSNKS